MAKNGSVNLRTKSSEGDGNDKVLTPMLVTDAATVPDSSIDIADF